MNMLGERREICVACDSFLDIDLDPVVGGPRKMARLHLGRWALEEPFKWSILRRHENI